MKTLVAVTILASALVSAGCSSSTSHGNVSDVGPTNTASGNGNPGGSTSAPVAASNVALFQVLAGVLPYPTDLYFSGTTDGTLNIQPASPLQPNQAAINALDGFSTIAPIRERFGGALDPTTLTAANVRMIEVNVDNATKATVGVRRLLTLGTDFSVALATDTGVGNQIVEIKPLKPLTPSRGAANVGYLVILTNGIKDASGNAVVPDADYAAIKAAQPTCASITNTTLNGVCRLTGAHLQIAQAVGVNPANIVVTFSFSTQSTRDVLDAVAAIVTASPPAPIAVQPLPCPAPLNICTTKQINAALAGKANVWVGTLTLPYYLSKTAPTTGSWQAAGPSTVPGIDPTSRFLTRFNPVPGKTQNITIPVLVTVPNANSLSGGVEPATGWPVLIFQHGITRNREDMFGLADSFADAGFVVVAIDMPLHGITSPADPLYQAANERTFNLDLANNTTGAAGPDGVIDSSGSNFIQLSSLLTSRDNLREAAVDLLSLTRALPTLSLGNNPAGDINPARIHFLGHSLGAMIGGDYVGFTSQVKTATLAMPGGGIPYLLASSGSFGPRILGGLAQQGITQGSTLLANFLRDAQTALDAGDPANFIAFAVASHPVHIIQVVGSATSLPDQTIPNSATALLIAAANVAPTSLTRFNLGVNPIASGAGGYVNFVVGSHGSIIDPSSSPAATVEMQREAIALAAGYNPAADASAIVINDPSVVQQ